MRVQRGECVRPEWNRPRRHQCLWQLQRALEHGFADGQTGGLEIHSGPSQRQQFAVRSPVAAINRAGAVARLLRLRASWELETEKVYRDHRRPGERRLRWTHDDEGFPARRVRTIFSGFADACRGARAAHQNRREEARELSRGTVSVPRVREAPPFGGFAATRGVFRIRSADRRGTAAR